MKTKHKMAAATVFTAFCTQASAGSFIITSEVPMNTNPSPYIADFIEKVEELSEGRLNGQYFEASQLYTDTEALGALGTGGVHFVLPVSSRLESLDRRTGLLNLPFTITYENMTNECFYNGIVELTGEYLDSTGIKPLGFMRTAELMFLMRDNEVTQVKDLEGQRIRLVGGRVMQDAMQQIGANPISMAATEMSVALSQRAIDGAMTSPAGWANVLGMSAKHGVTFPGMSLATSAIVVDEQWYNQLPEESKEHIENALTQVIEKQWISTVKEDEELIQEMLDRGASYHIASQEEVDRMKATFSNASDSFFSSHPDVYNDLKNLRSQCL